MIKKRLTKIIATVGPSSEREEVLKELFNYVDAFRLNFSHGDHKEHGKRIALIRKLERELNKRIPIILDTKGPEIRTGLFEKEIFLKKGQIVRIKNQEIIGNEKEFCVSYEDLYKEVEKGDKILIDDGLIELEVLEVEGKDIVCEVKNEGFISSKKSVNLPGKELNIEFLSEKDKVDIKFGVENDLDFLALSFVRSAKDIKKVKAYLKELNAKNFKIIAKIENKKALENLEEILEESDGVMVARGDLGVEIPVEEVPIWQKKIIEMAREKGKFTIVATQMLDSMINNPRPTRAEASDVINAVFDKTDAVMLSGETAKGKFPIESVKMMDKLLRKAEELIKPFYYEIKDYTDFVAKSAVNASYELEVEAIVAPSKSGYTPSAISNFRPKCPIYAFVLDEKTAKWINIRFGIFPFVKKEIKELFERVKYTLATLLDKDLVKKESLVVVVAGTHKKKTNALIIDKVKELLQ
jgi:pyruvate kinase